MNPALIVLIVIAVVLVVAFIVLTILGKKAQKRKEEQDEQIAAASQTVNMLIIDKKRMKLKDAGLPQQIIEQTPKLMRRSKLPVVKAKVGPRVMSLIAAEQIFDEIPLRKRSRLLSAVSTSQLSAVSEDLLRSLRRKKASVQEWQKTTARPTNSSRLRRLQRLKEKLLKRQPKRLSRNNIMI